MVIGRARSGRPDPAGALAVVETDPDESFEQLCHLAVNVCGAACSVISVADGNHHWAMAAHGDFSAFPPDSSASWELSAAAMGTREVVVVTDLAADPLYADNVLVRSGPRLRSAVSVPMAIGHDAPVGALCIVDVRPRGFDEEQLLLLRGLADQASALLELRRLRLLLLMVSPLPRPDTAEFPLASLREGRAGWALRQLLSIADASVPSEQPEPARSPRVPELNRLTNRELDIVVRLLGGDRVPVIAERLFLSQSTVRNHLSAVFGKLGVASQQELIDLLRGPGR